MMSVTETRDAQAEQRRLDRVAIAAAVAALFGGPVKIGRIRAVPGHGEGAWVREGRLAIQTAHRMAAPLIRPTAAARRGSA